MSVFQRGGSYLHQRLTKLYSDTKQSYESAAATTAPVSSAVNDPDVDALRREFQSQKDRLLAWGLNWTDTKAARTQSLSGSDDVEIDERLNRAGLSDVVANVMSEIQRLLIESRDLQRPKKKMRTSSKMSLGPVSFQSETQSESPWTWHELAGSKSLLAQLTTCIDVLYKLSDSKRSNSDNPKVDQQVSPEKGKSSVSRDIGSPSLMEKPIQSQAPRDSDGPQSTDAEMIPLDPPRTISDLLIPYEQLTIQAFRSVSGSNLPLYEEAMAHKRERCVAKWKHATVLVEFVSIANDPGWATNIKDHVMQFRRGLGQLNRFSEPVSQMRRSPSLSASAPMTEGSDSMSASTSLSHTGHAELIGYTIDTTRDRIGLIYELPTLKSSAIDVKPKALASVLSGHMDSSDVSSPPLEDRIRLAYNVFVAVLGLHVEGAFHGHLDSTNVVIFEPLLGQPAIENTEQDGGHSSHSQDRERVVSNSASPIRRPYLFSHAQLFPASQHFRDILTMNIYRYPESSSFHGIAGRQFCEIYSLGLVLLEIGLWIPLSKFWKQKYDAAAFRAKIKNHYVQKLASRCGTGYMQVVMRCLDFPEDVARIVSGSNLSLASMRAQLIKSEHLLDILRDLARYCAIDVDGAPTAPDLMHLQKRIALRRRELSPPEAESVPYAPMTPQSLADEDEAESKLESKPAAPTLEKPAKEAAVLRKRPEADIPQAHLDEWNTNLMPRISKLLQNALQGSPGSCSAGLMMVGETPETARTTICIQCADVPKVRHALENGFRPRKGWGVVVLKGEVRRSGKKRKKSKNGKKAATPGTASEETEQSSYQDRPTSGASIGVYRNEQHLPPVSFGGTILVDGKPFGMTVHHMLDVPSDSEDEEDDENITRCAAPARRLPSALTAPQELQFMQSDENLPDLLAPLQISDDDNDDDDNDDDEEEEEEEEEDDDESDSSTIRPDYAVFDEEGNEFWFLDDAPPRTPELEDDLGSDSGNEEDEGEEGDGDDYASIGDIEGFSPFDDEELIVTQPAIDDVDADVFPNEEDRDEDHLASHTLGYVHASSGIRRFVQDNLKHEIDWALIKIHDERLNVGNAIKQEQLERKQSSPQSKSRHHNSRSTQARTDKPPTVVELTAIAPLPSLPNTPVSCRGRTSGHSSGTISPALALVKMHGRASFSSSYCVHGGFGVPGDSGAWVYNPTTGEVCGHVLAWGERSGTAYIAPMQVLVQDIARTLGAGSVSLPGAAGAAVQVERFERMEESVDGRGENLTSDRAVHDRRGGQAEGEGEDEDMTLIDSSPLSPHHTLNKSLALARPHKVQLSFGDISLANHGQAKFPNSIPQQHQFQRAVRASASSHPPPKASGPGTAPSSLSLTQSQSKPLPLLPHPPSSLSPPPPPPSSLSSRPASQSNDLPDAYAVATQILAARHAGGLGDDVAGQLIAGPLVGRN